MPRVLNQRDLAELPDGAVYVGRPSKWGNPYKAGRDGTREEVIALYEANLLADPFLMSQLDELRGRDLVCWCAPLRCHADVLLRLANSNGSTPPR